MAPARRRPRAKPLVMSRNLHYGGAGRIIAGMHTERLSDDVYVFTSELYYQVTASLIVSGTVGVLIDTLPFPEETVQIAQLVNRLCPDGVRYIIYTQHQADHIYGAAFFPRAEVISHTRCRERMIEQGFDALERAKTQSPTLNLVKLRLPTLTFDTGVFALRLPGKTLELMRAPGHTSDAVMVLLQEEKLLFAGDTIMSLPTVSDPESDIPALRQTIDFVAGMQLDAIVQGHGEIILRGEIREAMRRGQHYLDTLAAKITAIVESGAGREEAARLPIEQCGMPRVLLNGSVVHLHTANAVALFDRLVSGRGPIRTPVAEVPAAQDEAAPKRTRPPKQKAGSRVTSTPKKASPKKPAKRKPAVAKRAAAQKPAAAKRKAAQKPAARKPAAAKRKTAKTSAKQKAASKRPATRKSPKAR